MTFERVAAIWDGSMHRFALQFWWSDGETTYCYLPQHISKEELAARLRLFAKTTAGDVTDVEPVDAGPVHTPATA